MPLHLIIGPAGSGKTRILMGLAHKITQEQRQLLYWVGLPHQRERTLSRLAKVGTLLGNQFVTLQQLYYHLLEDHPDVKLLAGPGLQLAHLAFAGGATAKLPRVHPRLCDARRQSVSA